MNKRIVGGLLIIFGILIVISEIKLCKIEWLGSGLVQYSYSCLFWSATIGVILAIISIFLIKKK